MGLFGNLFSGDTPVKILQKEGVGGISKFNKMQMQEVFLWGTDLAAKYGQILEKHSNPIESTAYLPASKKDIKLAIQLSIMAHTLQKNENIIKAYASTYMALANFQDISKEEAASCWTNNIATISEQANKCQNNEEKAQLFAQSIIKSGNLQNSVMLKQKQEAEQLYKEICAFIGAIKKHI